MKFKFNKLKNNKLIKERGISFQEIINILEKDGALAIEKNTSRNHINQFLYIVKYNNRYYSIPFVEQNEDSIFLKTIFESRKARKKYENR